MTIAHETAGIEEPGYHSSGEDGTAAHHLQPGQFSFYTEHPIDQARMWAQRFRSYHHSSRSSVMSGLEHAHIALYSGGLATPEEVREVSVE